MNGELGIPRVPQDRNWFFAMGLAAPNEMAGIVDRLKTDPRALKLAGRFLNVGNGHCLYAPEGLARWWIWRANEVGPDQANRDLNSYLDIEEVEASEHVWVFGIDVRSPIALTETISLLPWEKAPLSPLWLEVASEHLSGVPDQSHPVSVIVRPRMIQRDYAPSESPSVLLPDFDGLVALAYLLNALPGVRAVPGTRAFSLSAQTPPGPFGGYGWGTFNLEIKPRGPGTVEAFPTELFRRLVDRFNSGDSQKWGRALRRLAQAKSRMDAADSVLDLGVALEMVLLDGKVEQLSLAFRTRGAWLLGNEPLERVEIYEALRRLYNLRSEVAHTGRSKTLEKLNNAEARYLLASGFGLAERIYAKLLLDGVPDWTELTLGVPGPSDAGAQG